MTINRYRYFYACAFDMYGDHLFASVGCPLVIETPRP